MIDDLLKGVSLYLVGMMGAGKTTVGKRLAQQLNYRFADTDAVIEQLVRKPIRDFFAESGEAAFRQLETQVLAEIAPYTRMVISTGGGVVTQRQNWSYLHQGIVLWLDVPVDTLLNRLKGDHNRPLLQTTDPKATLESLLKQRSPLYAQADVRVVCASGDDHDQTVEKVLMALKSSIRKPLEPPSSIELN